MFARAPLRAMGRGYCYQHSGVLVRSQIAIPEWQPFVSEHDSEADVEIGFVELEPEFSNNNAASHWDGTTLSFTVDDIAHWSISGGDRIAIAPFEGAHETALRSFTLGSSWAAIGYQRGWAMLHGSAVEIGGRAVLFCGGQERGKSTMAAALCARGARLMVDDLSRVEAGADGEAALLYPSAPRLKLWQDAIAHLGLADSIAAQDDFRDAKYHLSSNADASAESVELAAIIVLDWGDRLDFEHLQGSTALMSVLEEAAYRPEMVEAMGVHSEQAAHFARIVSSTPVWRMQRPREFAKIGTVCETVEQLAADLTVN